MSLNAHLDALDRERVLGGKDGGATAALGQALIADAALSAAARAELLRLDALAEACHGRLAERCFASAQRRAALAAALAAFDARNRS